MTVADESRPGVDSTEKKKGRMKGRHRSPRGEMPFLDHLEELRWRIIWSGVAILVGAIISFCLVYYFDLIEHLINRGTGCAQIIRADESKG